MLKENDVSRNMNRIGNKVQNFITFYAMGIAQEHTLPSPRCKFVPIMR